MSQIDCGHLDPNDAPELHRLLLEAGEKEPLAFGHSSTDERIGTDYLRHEIEDGKWVGAKQNDTLFGCFCLKTRGDTQLRHKADLGSLYVRDDGRRKGAARMMLEHIVRHAPPFVTMFRSFIESTNAPSLAYFRACGFQAVGVEDGARMLNGRPLDEIVMQAYRCSLLTNDLPHLFKGSDPLVRDLDGKVKEAVIVSNGAQIPLMSYTSALLVVDVDDLSKATAYFAVDRKSAHATAFRMGGKALVSMQAKEGINGSNVQISGDAAVVAEPKDIFTGVSQEEQVFAVHGTLAVVRGVASLARVGVKTFPHP